jgi:hypothetical protein
VENSVKRKLDAEGVPVDSESSFKRKVEIANRFNLLSHKEAADARIVWDRGNKAGHYDPEVTKDVIGTIRMTMSVLEACA